jgi:S1-C subfamily serine protease
MAEVVGSDTVSDVALLDLRGDPPADAHVAALGDSDAVRIGQRVFVVGAPRGISHTLTVGHVSARHKPERTVHTFFDTELFQTDAAINQGNSGGPMFNMDGEVIGVVSHIVSRSGGSEGLGFAVTSNVVRELLIDTPAVWTGIEVIRVSGPLARILNLPDEREGLLVQHVARKSPLGSVGLRGGKYVASISGERFVAGGDVILEVGGMRVGGEDTFDDIRRLVRGLKDGDRVDIMILRGGEIETLHLRFER